MMDKLLYVYSADEYERAQRRVILAEETGFRVEAVTNEDYLHAEHEEELLELVSGDECAGVWLDFKISDIGRRTRRIALAAGEAGKRVLGKVRDGDEKVLLVAIIGLPKDEVTQQ